MSTVLEKDKSITPTPQSYHTITPYLVVQDVPALIDFLKQAFGAEQTFQAIGSAGGIHAEVRVGDSELMIGGGGPEVSWKGESMPQSLHLYVPDADAVYRRAMQAGAISTEEPTDQPYGDREAGVKDPVGNLWWIATRQQGGPVPEGLRTVTPFMFAPNADAFMEFLKGAFGAEIIARHALPSGRVAHAMVQIGDSMLEMGETHGPWQAMPSMFVVHVPNVDASFRQALAAGAMALEQPANQPYGERRAAVKDAFGNQWYVSAPIEKT